MADDERTEDGSGGFDDWLDEEPGPATDPYAALADDDAEGEIADWMAFTAGADADSHADSPEGSSHGDAPGESDADVQPVAEPAPDDDTVEVDASTGNDDGAISEAEEGATEAFDPDAVAAIPVIAPPDDDRSYGGDRIDESSEVDDQTAEIPVAVANEQDVTGDVDDEDPSIEQAASDPTMVPATSVDLDEVDGGGRPDTEEVPIIAGASVAAASAIDDERPPTRDESPHVDTGELDLDQVDGGVGSDDDQAMGEVDDTGEMEVVPFPEPEGFGDDVHANAAEDGLGVADVHDDTDDGVFDLSQEHYVQTATREHAGLAAAIAEADNEDTEQVALAAPIPGLESTVVGFDDVVEAEGHSRVRARASGDLIARVITAIVLIAALAASLLWRPALVALATIVFIIGAGEFYTALTRSGRHPISLFGFVGILAASIGAFVWGAVAIPTAFLIVATVLLLFYAVVPGRVDPMGNLALTVTVMAWVGLGTYAMMIAVSDDYQTLVVGVVVTVAAMDIAQYFVGRAIGRHKLSPWVSPKKTIEGLIAGIIVALALGALLHFFPPFELTSGLAIGAAVAILSPLGDLAMSAAKRTLDIKDMGSILPGHGGFLDRIDGLLFVIPAAWAIFTWAGLL